MSSTSWSKYFAAALVLGLAGTAPALAADDVSPTSSYMDLVGKGFEVRDVSVVTGEAADAMAGIKDAGPQALVTLQHGGETAVCFFNAINWMNLVPASLTKADRCAIH